METFNVICRACCCLVIVSHIVNSRSRFGLDALVNTYYRIMFSAGGIALILRLQDKLFYPCSIYALY